MARASQTKSIQQHNGATGAPVPPTDARLDEIARILALGILRLRAREQAKSGDSAQETESDFGLDFSPHQSVHADG